MSEQDRPLSPHLQIYRLQLHMVLSGLHRITGAALGLGTILLAWWLMALAAGPAAYTFFVDLAGGLIGQIVLFGFTGSLIYHLFNGIRHLYWDAGHGFEPQTVRLTGILVVAGTVAATLGAWVVAYYLLGRL